MGCGESKHAVSTADTISQTKRSNSKKANGQENPTGIETATNDVKRNTNASLEEQEKSAKVVVNEDENVNKDSGGAIVKESEISKADDLTKSEVPKADDVKESDHQEKGETVVEIVKEKENKETAVVPEDTKDESEKKDLKEESTEETKREEAGGAALIPHPRKVHMSSKQMQMTLNEKSKMKYGSYQNSRRRPRPLLRKTN